MNTREQSNVMSTNNVVGFHKPAACLHAFMHILTLHSPSCTDRFSQQCTRSMLHGALVDAAWQQQHRTRLNDTHTTQHALHRARQAQVGPISGMLARIYAHYDTTQPQLYTGSASSAPGRCCTQHWLMRHSSSCCSSTVLATIIIIILPIQAIATAPSAPPQ
ncbi:hypothetical protein COO60DRAFT_1102534 [Scenedesmus sp. NREL 46B-D3]|nr:hypothetical protein COO60DRAFT_1102534 [Scenedesmus sp. NREL 46B-D3]